MPAGSRLGVKRGPYKIKGLLESGRNCSKCTEFKPWSEFYESTRGKNGRESRCKTCCRRVLAKLEPHAYDLILAYQDWKCAVCKTDKPGGHGAWHTDHNHATNEIRGLLCLLCNLRVGWYEQDNRDVRRYLATR